MRHLGIAGVLAFLAGLVTGCVTNPPAADSNKTGKETAAVSFKSDLDFLRANTEIVVLSDKAGQAQVAVSPAWQGRVMTSTAAGDGGVSFGWINRELIASKKIQEHINVFGGEDRFWLGPEGGPFSIFFAKGKAQTLANWFTPAAIDTEPFAVQSKSSDRAVFGRSFSLKNASGAGFDVRVDRAVQLLEADKALALLPGGIKPSAGVKLVAYETQNTIANAGKEAWKKETGLLSVWILGMYNPSPATTVVLPFQKGPEAELGAIVNDVYFGKVPADRLKVDAAGGVMFFSADGTYRSKIGIPPKRALPIVGSYDATNRVLTLVQYNAPADMGKVVYVNSVWGDQKDPYAGDVINSYNDGPPEPGKKPLGPFYEIESSSPGAALAPGASLTHIHRTFHIQGDEKSLDEIARKTLGVGLAQITSAFKK